jgi:outer membrane protein TolC
MKCVQLAVGMLMAGFSLTHAQITLDQCLERAKAFSLKSRSAELSLHASSLARRELEKGRLPQLKLNSDVSYAPTSGTFGYDPAITDGGQIGARIALQQSLYDGGVRGLKLSALELEQNSLEKEKLRTIRDLTFAVKALFIEALQSQKKIELQQESVRQLEDYLDIVQRLAKGGGAAHTDMLKTEVQLQAAQRSSQKAREALATVTYALAELMGCPVDTQFTAAGRLEELIPRGGQAPDPALVPQNLDVVLAQLDMQKSTFETEIAKSERLPILNAMADAGILTSIDNLRLPASDRSGVYGYLVGLTLEVPILNWGATDLRVQQRQLATEGLALELREVERSVGAEYRRTLLHLQNVDERLKSTRASLRSAEENFALTRAKYASGAVLSLEVLSAQQMLTDLKLEELETLSGQQTLLAKLEQIMSR